MLAARLLDGSWLSGAVESLDPAGRCGLRLLCVGPLPRQELDALAGRISGDHSSTAFEQLFGAGLAWVTDGIVSLPESLRSRLRALATDVPGPTPPEPSSSDETFVEQRFSFTLGAALCAVRSLSPRATRLGQIHRSDARALSDALAALAGDATRAMTFLEELVRAGLVQLDGVRARVAQESVPDASSRLFLHRLEVAVRDSRLAAGLNVLLETPDWVRSSDVVEAIAGESIRKRIGNEDLCSMSHERLRRLEECGGLLARVDGGVTWWRLSEAARRALAGHSWNQPDSSPSLQVLPHLQIVASLNTPVDVFVELGGFCRFEDADQVARLKIELEQAQRAARHSMQASDALELLERNARHGVPHTVARALSDWMKVDNEARLLVGSVLLSQAPEDDVKRLVDAIPCRLIAPGVWLLPEKDAPAVTDALRTAGWAVTTTAANASPASEWHVPERSLDARAESIREAARVAGLALL